MGQFASGTAPDRIDQARALFRLNPDVDLAYLEARIRHESSGDHGIEDLRTDGERWPGPRITHAEFAARLAARRAELGEAADLPRNAGTRRTPSKRALLKAIEEAGGKW